MLCKAETATANSGYGFRSTQVPEFLVQQVFRGLQAERSRECPEFMRGHGRVSCSPRAPTLEDISVFIECTGSKVAARAFNENFGPGLRGRFDFASFVKWAASE